MTEKYDPVQQDIRIREEREITIRGHIESGEENELNSYLAGLEPEDIAGLLREFTEPEKIVIFNSLDPESAAIVIDDTDSQSRLLLLQNLNNEKLSEILDEMPVDEAADIIEEVSEEKREDLLRLMEKEDAEDVEDILSYPEDSAGRVMDTHFVSVCEEDDISDAINHIRESDIEEDFFFVYVVDKDSRLKGFVSLKKFLLSPKGTSIKDIMETDIHPAYADVDQEHVAESMRKYDLFSIPVIDKDDLLVGRITADDIIDVIDEEHAEDMSHMTGTIEEESGSEGPLKAAKNRLPWLITCMFGSIVTGIVIQMHEVTLGEMIALVSFIPVITATGGNSGVQASTVVVRSIALGYMDFSKIGEEIWRQFRIALSLGLICGVVLTVLASYWKHNSLLGLITGLSIFLVIVWSNFVGVLVPLMFKKIRMDPAIAAGPLITTMNDVIGVFIYLSVASFFLRHGGF